MMLLNLRLMTSLFSKMWMNQLNSKTMTSMKMQIIMLMITVEVITVVAMVIKQM